MYRAAYKYYKVRGLIPTLRKDAVESCANDRYRTEHA